MADEINAFHLVRGHGGSRVIDVLKEAYLVGTYWYGSESERSQTIAIVLAGTDDAAPRLLPPSLHFKAKSIPGHLRLLRCPIAYRIIGHQWTSLPNFDNALQMLANVLPTYPKHVFCRNTTAF